MEPLAQKMMAEDPELADLFAKRLQSDSLFAANPRARRAFFYQHSPWRDREKDLCPVWRLTGEILLVLEEF